METSIKKGKNIMKYKYIKVTAGGSMLWGINELSKDRFVASVQAGDVIIDVEAQTYFDKETNTWKDIDGDS